MRFGCVLSLGQVRRTKNNVRISAEDGVAQVQLHTEMTLS